MAREAYTVEDGPLEGAVYALDRATFQDDEVSLRLHDGGVAVYRFHDFQYRLNFVGFDPFA